MSVQLQPKSLSRFQTYLIGLKTSVRLFGEVLTEAKKLTESIEGLFHAVERVFVVFVCLVLSVIGAVTLISYKVDLPHLIERLSLFLRGS